MINYNQAHKILKKSKIKIQDEEISIKDSLNRVVSKDIFSPSDHPLCNNAAFDGFVINSNDTNNINKKKSMHFRIVGSVAAGTKPFNKKAQKYEAIEIMTGGVISKPFNTVIPIEKIIFYPNKKKPQSIIINQNFKKYDYVRFKGSDYKKGQLVIKKGNIIRANHILALKTLGIKKIKVKKKVNILFFSTGNEISNLDKIPTWKVRNSNSHYIENLNNNFLFNFKNGGILKDHHHQLFKSKIEQMLKSNNIDIIITSGAVSAGKFDLYRVLLNNLKRQIILKV